MIRPLPPFPTLLFRSFCPRNDLKKLRKGTRYTRSHPARNLHPDTWCVYSHWPSRYVFTIFPSSYVVSLTSFHIVLDDKCERLVQSSPVMYQVVKSRLLWIKLQLDTTSASEVHMSHWNLCKCEYVRIRAESNSNTVAMPMPPGWLRQRPSSPQQCRSLDFQEKHPPCLPTCLPRVFQTNHWSPDQLKDMHVSAESYKVSGVS